jgi:hypothetical protein
MSALARRRRWGLLGAALFATLVASLWAVGDEAPEDLRPPSRAVPASGEAAAGAAGLPEESTVRPAAAVLRLPQRSDPAPQGRRDLFAAYGRPAARPAATASAPPAPPPLPLTLPFGFAGRLITADVSSILLSQGSQTLVLAVGEQWGDFRLEQDGGTHLSFVHLPTGERLPLATQP